MTDEPCEEGRGDGPLGQDSFVANSFFGSYAEQRAFDGILSLLFNHERVDFAHYRQSTVIRRIARRMGLCKLTSFGEYLLRLEDDKKELDALHHDLLLFFTEFFRDPQVFDTLRNEIFPLLVKNRTVKNPIRVWVPGCSTGEEVYSLAIELYEYLEARRLEVTAQFFGTDLVERHIVRARAALYPEKIESHVSAERLERFFDKTADGYRVIKHIREMCVFATQDITQDPPFPNIDLLSCRNLLIYFDTTFQDVVMPLFHFALKPNGFLLLGTSETLGRFPQLFSPVNKRHNIFAKRLLSSRVPYKFPATPVTFNQKVRSQTENIERSKPSEFSELSKAIDQLLLERYAPPGVVIDSSMQIRQFRGPTAEFLDPAKGEASLKLSKMTGGNLMPDLYVAIEEVKHHCQPVRKRNVSFVRNGKSSNIDISVLPVEMDPQQEPFFLILFEPPSAHLLPSFPRNVADQLQGDERDTELEQLRHELMATKEYLQTIIEEKDEVNQELWTANEEVQSTNEELQSVNEELEAAKEELESSNEELIALNEELHHKNSELTEANALNECTINGSMDGILTFDPDLRIKIWNPAMERMWGIRREDCLDRPLLELFPFLADSGHYDIFQAVLRGEPVIVDNQLYLNRHVRAEGYFEGRYSPLRDQNDRIIGGLGIIHDSTNRKLAEEKLQESEERFKMVMHQSPAAIELYDSDGLLISVNRAYEKMWGIAAEQIVFNKTLASQGTAAPNLSSYVQKAFSGETIVVPEYSIRLNGAAEDGVERWLSSQLYPLKNSTGKITNLVISHEDITSRKRAEEDMLKLHKLESIGTLAGGIAHDFNNILMGLFGSIALAKNEMEDCQAAREHLQDALASMNRATRLTQQLLIFAKGGSPVREGVSLGTLVEEVVRFDLSGSNIKPEFAIAGDLWVTEVDRGQMQQVFSNLTVNAKQAMEEGGYLYVALENTECRDGELAELKAGRYVKVTFRDQGVGIESRILNQIFDPYFTTKRFGRGLGLATTYSIIKKHGGRITVQSTPGMGSVFTLFLPVSTATSQIDGGEPVMVNSTPPGQVRILIMDDEPMICKVTKLFLEKEGYVVDTVIDGEKAIEAYDRAMAAGQPFAVVIMDLTIPGGLGGRGAVRKILEIDPAARVIVSSGYAEDPVMANFAEHGFKGVAPKPYSKKKLIEVVQRVLASS